MAAGTALSRLTGVGRLFALGYSTGEYGNDWLAKQPSDIMRPISFVPTQSNQIYYSWHKTGRAVDIPQSGPGLVHAADTSAPGYELFYLRSKAGQLISITNIMLAAGFARIPSTPGRPSRHGTRPGLRSGRR